MSACEQYLSSHQEAELKKVAEALANQNKGILVADEFSAIGKYEIEDNEDNRRRYYEMIFTAGNRNDLSKCISGVAMSDETTHQKDSNGMPFVKVDFTKG